MPILLAGEDFPRGRIMIHEARHFSFNGRRRLFTKRRVNCLAMESKEVTLQSCLFPCEYMLNFGIFPYPEHHYKYRSLDDKMVQRLVRRSSRRRTTCKELGRVSNCDGLKKCDQSSGSGPCPSLVVYELKKVSFSIKEE